MTEYIVEPKSRKDLRVLAETLRKHLRLKDELWVPNVDTTFSPDGKWEGIKILKGTGTQHGLPESSHSSSAYIKLDQNGKFREIQQHIPWVSELVWHTQSASMQECLEKFEKAAIFNGKSFWDMESEIEWVDE